MFAEIKDLQQNHPNGKFCRVKDSKVLRMNMTNFNLLVYYSKTKLAGDWQHTGENTHVYGDVYEQMGH